jgi:hypothetical protein
MKIVDFESYKKYVNKLDGMAQDNPSKVNINFNSDEKNVADKFKRFFDIADGKPYWQV